MRSLILCCICLIVLCLIYEFGPKCERREFRKTEPVVKRDGKSYIVLSLSDDSVARFYAVPKAEIDQMKPINFNNFVYYFYATGVFKKGVSNFFTGSEHSIRLKDDSKEKEFVTNIRYGKYKLVHSEPNYSYESSTYGFNDEDYDLVVRTTH